MMEVLNQGAASVIATTELLQNQYDRDADSDGSISDDHEDWYERSIGFHDHDDEVFFSEEDIKEIYEDASKITDIRKLGKIIYMIPYRLN
jgi:hypothetical protein